MTDAHLDAARASIAAAEQAHAAQVAALEATLADVRALHTQTRTDLAAALARIVELEALIDPPEVATVFGMSRPDNTVGLTPMVPVVRTYLGAGKRPESVAEDAGLRRAFAQVPADGTVWISHKEIASGLWLDFLLTDIAATHPGVKVLLTARHEPWDDLYSQGLLTTYHAHQDAMEAVAAKHDHVTPVTIWENSHRPSVSPGYWEAVERPGQEYGFDAYNPGIQEPRAYADPHSIYGEIVDWCAARGRRPYIGETGTGPVAGDAAGRAAWVAAARAYLDGKAVVAAYWNAQACTLTAPEAAGWL